jgi:hypothetical protein
MCFGYLRIRVTRRRSIFERSILSGYYHLIATSAHDTLSIHSSLFELSVPYIIIITLSRCPHIIHYPSIQYIIYYFLYLLSINTFLYFLSLLISCIEFEFITHHIIFSSDRSSAPGHSSLYPGHRQIPPDMSCPPISQALARRAGLAARILHRSCSSFRRRLREQ